MEALEAQPQVIILGAFPFPDGGAPANRLLSLAYSLRRAGYRPLVVNRTLSRDAATPTIRFHDSIPFVNFPSGSRSPAVRAYKRMRFAGDVVAFLRETDLLDSVTTAIFATEAFNEGMARRLRRLVGARIVIDIVERHEARQYRLGHLEPHFLRHRFVCWRAGSVADGLIVISRQLAARYPETDVTVVPAMIDETGYKGPSGSSRPATGLHVAYCGSPGTKDNLGVVLAAFREFVTRVTDDSHLSIVGVSPDELKALPAVRWDDVQRLGDNLSVHGRLRRGQVLDILSGAHYSILIRDPRSVVAQHGFPSKIPESLGVSCPPITNLSSDLGLYLADGRDSILAASDSLNDVYDALVRAHRAVVDGKYAALSAGAFQTSLEFRPENWAEALAGQVAPVSGIVG